MAGKKKFKHEWHLYSILTFGIVGTIILFTDFGLFWGAVGTALLAIFINVLQASDNWKNIDPELHKTLIIFFLLCGFVWALYHLYTGKIEPSLKKEGDIKNGNNRN